MIIPEFIEHNLLQEWIDQNDRKMTVEDVLSRKPIDPIILLYLLERVRDTIHGDKAAAPRDKLRATDQQLREDVRNHPNKYCFAIDALREYAPFSRGEMLVILLEKLKQNHIDARVHNATPAGDAEVGIAIPRDESKS